MKTHPQAPIAGPLRQQINVLAHAAGLAHESAVKAQLLAHINKLRAAGATYAEQLEAIETLQSEERIHD